MDLLNDLKPLIMRVSIKSDYYDHSKIEIDLSILPPIGSTLFFVQFMDQEEYALIFDEINDNDSLIEDIQYLRDIQLSKDKVGVYYELWYCSKPT